MTEYEHGRRSVPKCVGMILHYEICICVCAKFCAVYAWGSSPKKSHLSLNIITFVNFKVYYYWLTMTGKRNLISETVYCPWKLWAQVGDVSRFNLGMDK